MRSGFIYQPLKEHLQRASEPVVEMTYDEIEKVLGRDLPPSANGDYIRHWWANTMSHSQARAWLEAGRRAQVKVREKRVAFTRQEARPPAVKSGEGSGGASDSVEIVVGCDQLTPRAQRLLHDLMEAGGCDASSALAEMADQAASHRLKDIFAQFRGRALKAGSSSVDLIREDRDSR